MTKFSQTFIFILSLFLAKYSFGQTTPRGLKSEKLQKEIISNTLSYDSLILFDKSSFWSDDHSVKGFAFRKNSCFKTTITFRKTSEFIIELQTVDIEKDQVFDVLKNYIVSNFGSLKNLNNDSLNLQSRAKNAMSVSDAPEYSILFVFPKNHNTCSYKGSYAPEIYQEIAWTSDRQILLNAFSRLKSHIN